MDQLLPVVEQKLVSFNEAEIMAVKTEDNKIFAAVKWVCDGMGLTLGQYQNQTRKLNDDIVLREGIAKMQLLTNGGTQEVLCIELDYLPLWLAKINAGIIEDPIVQASVIEYQLKAKDVLAAAFIKQTQAPVSIEDAVIYSMQELKQVKERQTFQEMELNKVKLIVDQEVWITEHQKQLLKDRVSRRVYELRDEGYEAASFQGVYGALKRHFGVSKYDKIPRKDFQTAMRFVNGWYPVVKQDAMFDETAL